MIASSVRIRGTVTQPRRRDHTACGPPGLSDDVVVHRQRDPDLPQLLRGQVFQEALQVICHRRGRRAQPGPLNLGNRRVTPHVGHRPQLLQVPDVVHVLQLLGEVQGGVERSEGDRAVLGAAAAGEPEQCHRPATGRPQHRAGDLELRHRVFSSHAYRYLGGQSSREARPSSVW